MNSAKLIFILCTIFSTFSETVACKGCVSLDEYNFNKIVSRFKVVLVKFDLPYPYGDKHEIFTKLAEELVINKNVILAEVGVKDYGDRDNDILAKKYGINDKDDLPALRLFVNGISNEAVEFLNSTVWTLESLRNFIRDNSGIYVGLPGCLEKMDKLAEEFVLASDKPLKYKYIEKATKNLLEHERDTAATYLKVMRKILLHGIDFINQEHIRVAKIINDGNVNEKKKEDLSYRLNILRSFPTPKKDEL